MAGTLQIIYVLLRDAKRSRYQTFRTGRSFPLHAKIEIYLLACVNCLFVGMHIVLRECCFSGFGRWLCCCLLLHDGMGLGVVVRGG